MAPSVKRCIKAEENGIRFLCIQCKENSLTQFTYGDGAIDKTIEWKIQCLSMTETNDWKR